MKIKFIRLIPVLFDPRSLWAQAYKTGINNIILILIFVENCLLYDAINNFQYGLEQVLIQRILIGFEATLKRKLSISLSKLQTSKRKGNLS